MALCCSKRVTLEQMFACGSALQENKTQRMSCKLIALVTVELRAEVVQRMLNDCEYVVRLECSWRNRI